MNSKIINDIYNSAEEATNRSKELGCDGYRKYVIDGETKYVPCASAKDYELTLRYRDVQGKTASSGLDTSSDKLVGYQFASNTDKSDALFTLGNFQITTSKSSRTTDTFIQSDSTKTVTAETYTLSGLTELNKKIESAARAVVNFDKSKFDKYVLYGSLNERIRYSMQEIIERFPASLIFYPRSVVTDVVTNYSYSTFDNVSTFVVNLTNSRNPFTIVTDRATSDEGLGTDITEIRDLTTQYTKYSLIHKGVEYEIIDGEFPANSDDPFITLTVEGNPFSTSINNNQSANVEFSLKPKKQYIDDFYNEVDDLTAYLLNTDSTTTYACKFKDPVFNNGVLELRSRTIIFPTVDGYNPDMVSSKFDTYSTQLTQLAENQDNYKTNLILRLLTSDTLQEYDTEDRKIKIVLDSYGRMFDEVRKYVQGISYMRNVSYDKISNVPDVLLKNFARMIGWESFNIQNDDSLAKSLFSTDVVEKNEADIISELDIELWRRIIINTAYLFKSKGTRKSLEFIMKLIGIPEEVIEMDEHVYVARQKLDYEQYANQLNDISAHPIDSDGYPTIPQLYYQAYGGNSTQDEKNVGPYDFGQAYIDEYKKFDNLFAFDVNRIQDNQKSWAYTGQTQTRVNTDDMNDTNYRIEHSKLAINSKEIDVHVGSNRVHDVLVYRFFKRGDYSIGSGMSANYPVTTNVPNITFNEFLRQVSTKYINVKNRKTIRNYPTLSKIYWDYLRLTKSNGSKQIDIKKSLQFLNKFDTYWLKLIRQFVPATSILSAGKKWENSIFAGSKHKYKHGRNSDIDWLGTDGSEFQNATKQGVFNASIPPFKPTAASKGQNEVNFKPWNTTANASVKNTAESNRGDFGLVYNYSFYDYCQYMSNKLTINHGQFGSFDESDSDALLTYNPSGSSIIISSGYSEDYAYEGASSLRIRLSSGDTPTTFDLKLFEINDVSFSANTTYTISAKVMVKPWISGTTLPLNVSDGVIEVLIDTGSTSGVASQIVVDRISDLSKITSGTWYTLEVEFTSDQNELTNIYFRFVDLVNNYTNYVGLDIFFDDVSVTEKSVSFNNAYSEIGIDFDCPPPLPHVCYYSPTNNDGISSGYTTVINEDFTTTTNWDSLPSLAGFSNMLDGTSGATFNTSGEGYLSIGLTTDPIYDGNYRVVYASGVTFNSGDWYRMVFEVETITTNGNHLTSLKSGKLINHIPKFYISLTSDDFFIIHPPTASGQRVKYEFFGRVNNTETRKPRILFNVPSNANYYVDNLDNCEFRVYNIQVERVPKTVVNASDYPVRQAYRYGFSKNSGTTLPPDYFVGTKSNYAVPYVSSGATGSTINGMYEAFMDRTLSDPLMHIKQGYAQYIKPSSEDTSITVNLTDSLDLFYLFRSPNGNGIKPDGEVDNKSYMSDSLTFDFDGLYPTTNTLNRTGVGPFYEVQDRFTLYGTTQSDVTCVKGEYTPIPIYNPYAGIYDDFDTGVDEFEFKRRTSNDGLIAVNEYNQIKIDCDFIMSSDYSGLQDVNLRLVNTGGTVYDETTVSFTGSDLIDDRVIQYTYTGFIRGGDELIIEVYPLDFDCVVKFSEDIIEDTPSTVYIFDGISGQTGTMISGQTGITTSTTTGTTNVEFSDVRWSNSFINNESYNQLIIDIPNYFDSANNEYSIIGYSGSTMVLYPIDYGFASNAFGNQQLNGVSQVTYDTSKILVHDRPKNRSKIIEQYDGIKYTYDDNAIISEYLNNVDPVWSEGDLLVKGIGTVNITGGGSNISGNGTNFTELFQSGDKILIDGQSILTVNNVSNSELLSVTGAATATTANVSYYRVVNSFDIDSLTRRKFSKVKIYKSDVTGIKLDLKNSLLTFFNNTDPSTGLVKKQPHDSIPDAQNLFFDSTDTSAREVFKYGSGTVTNENGKLILNYTFDKDLVGFIRTGEFIGKLSAKDVCGNSFTTYLIFVIDQDNSYLTEAEKVSRVSSRLVSANNNEPSNIVANDSFTIG